jgi:hypothetical protein
LVHLSHTTNDTSYGSMFVQRRKKKKEKKETKQEKKYKEKKNKNKFIMKEPKRN